MPRVNAYYAIHYGVDYLEYSIRSIYNAVDWIGIFYARLPSHGYRDPTLKNPDSEDEVRAVIRRAGDPQSKVVWLPGQWFSEGQHRDHAFMVTKSWGADLVLVVDSDEVWDPAVLPEVLVEAARMDAEHIRLPFIHFWRSFSWVCRDEMMPIRIQKAVRGQDGYLRPPTPVYHFGYAQRPDIVKYKAAIHGHRGEWRNGWFGEKFLAWSPAAQVGDVHPTCEDIWYPERFDKEQLPDLMRDHPYWNEELIR